MESNKMTVTIKVEPYEFQSICEIINKIKETNKKNKDTIELNLSEKVFVSSVFMRLAISGKRKADRLESLGSEVRNSFAFANCK